MTLGSRRALLCAFVGLLSLGACGAEPLDSFVTDFLAANVDTTVSPGEDFFRYANGAWLRRHAIPAGQGGIGVWDLVIDELQDRQRRISEDAAAGSHPRGSLDQLIGDFWFTGMDSAAIERQGLAPLQPDLDRIDAVQTLDDVMDIVALLHTRGMQNVLFTDFVTQDEEDSDRVVYVLRQGGLSLRTPEYHVDADEHAVRVRTAFRTYLLETFRALDGDSVRARARADTVYAVQDRLARGYRRGSEYRKIGLGDLEALAPTIDWSRYLGEIGVDVRDSLVMSHPVFFSALDTELRRTSLAAWTDYLRFWILDASAPYLDHATFLRAFEFRAVMTGQSEPLPRWSRVLEAQWEALGGPLAQRFASEYFPDPTRARYAAVVEACRAALARRIERLEWMSEGTKREALRKLDRMEATLGGPARSADFADVDIRRDAYVLNVMRAHEWHRRRDIRQLGEPVDRYAWYVNWDMREASYDAATNEIRLAPGSIIAPGVSDDQLDDAFVYGYTFIGHEISHGFDADGRHYDADGNRVGWWTAADSAEYANRASALVAQYDAFVVMDTLRVDGRQTLSENIADLVGLRITLDAFKATEQYQRNEEIGGFTPLQRFFLAFAYRQMGHRRPEALADQLLRDSHAPDRERVNGVVSHFPEFYEAFDVAPGDRMYRPEHARVRFFW